MSRYENWEKDNLASEIDTFLENHTISELLEIVKDSVEEKECENN